MLLSLTWAMTVRAYLADWRLPHRSEPKLQKPFLSGGETTVRRTSRPRDSAGRSLNGLMRSEKGDGR